MNEIWKDIPNYNGLYQVSNLGRVKSLPKKKYNHKGFYISKERILTLNNDGNYGYLTVVLYKNKIRKTFKVHKLVAMSFLNHNPCGYKLVVDHINDNPLDNRVENLQLITQRENTFKTQGKYTSQYKGVSWCKLTEKWMSQINGFRQI